MEKFIGKFVGEKAGEHLFESICRIRSGSEPEPEPGPRGGGGLQMLQMFNLQMFVCLFSKNLNSSG